jgi:hypothetical protein
MNKGEEVSYRAKQGISILMGSPMDSSMTPMAIQAAQGVFMNQAMQKQAAMTKPKKSTSKLTNVADNYMTPNEASTQRRNKA